MGCLFTGPLKKTMDGPKVVCDDSESESGDQLIRYISFGTFIRSDNPMIFEWLFQPKEIGKGAMSHVFLATNTETKMVCAAKVYNKSVLSKPVLGNEESPEMQVRREIEIMRRLHHRYQLRCVEFIDDDLLRSYIFMLPYAPFGTLQGYLETHHPGEEELSVCFFEIADALRDLHARNIVHRDLKPDNILVFSERKFVLSDFSVSQQLDSPDEKLADTKGTPAFLSPEECGREPFRPKESDVWAYGVTLYSCLFNCLPFNLDKGQGKNVANAIYALTELLQTEELEFPEDHGYSSQAIDLVRKVLQKDPALRPTFEEIVTDPWFEHAREVDQENIANGDCDEESENYVEEEEEEEEAAEEQVGE